jgi:hypothetical protein
MMADSELDLITTQIGKETVWGTAVPQTALLVGIENCELTPQMETTPVPESRGNLVPSYECGYLRRHLLLARQHVRHSDANWNRTIHIRLQSRLDQANPPNVHALQGRPRGCVFCDWRDCRHA